MIEQPVGVSTPEHSAGPGQPEEVAHVQARPRSRRLLIPLIVLVAVLLAFFLWREFFAAPSVPDSIVALSGRIEGDDSAVAPKTAGRILEIRVREGDTLKAGEVIAILDDEQVRARERAAGSALGAAEANARTARAQIAVLEQQLRQNHLLTDQAKLDAQGRVRQAEADLAAAQADLAQQQARYDLSLFDKDAYTRLARSGAVSERQGKLAVATADQDAAAVAAAKRRVEASEGALTTAQANLANRDIRESQVVGVEKQIAEQEAQIAGATASTEQARAQLAEAEANRQDLTVRAPFNGTVMTRAAEPGEVVQAGTAVITLLDLSKVYLRGFVPEGQIGKVAVGQPAHVYLDSNPKRPIDAYVSRIDPEATFTPENTYFRDDRVKQVVGLKLQLKQGFGFAKPGMPADGEVLVQGSTWPKDR
ncbi:MAG TPA: HlyD family efflux transporter periplasmic adaptor subunit [Verrucomicrobiae bacterium]|jgi:HlyD family secretion protein|nr:HlyD family efflux transporter periplasmic adaptor subunit [Verrucomicrobiae bacterium]